MSKYLAEFPDKGLQKSWLCSTGLSVEDMAVLCDCSERTIRDWRREKFSMDYGALLTLCRNVRLRQPSVKKVSRYRHLAAAGRKGGEAVIKKYGKVPVDDNRRLNGWKQWWQDEGQYKFNKILSPSEFTRPRRSRQLAEFVGIMLGDGGISSRQLTITLHAVDEVEYGRYVSSLITKLFNVPVRIRHKVKSAANDYVVSRIGLVNFCVKELGLVQGSKVKRGADIPDWIKRQRPFAVACLRGLIDTDGSLFVHEYRVGSRPYRYKKINFSNRSTFLLQSVYELMISLGLHPRVRGSMVCLDSRRDVVRYMKVVGTKNPKHLKRYLK